MTQKNLAFSRVTNNRKTLSWLRKITAITVYKSHTKKHRRSQVINMRRYPSCFTLYGTLYTRQKLKPYDIQLHTFGLQLTRIDVNLFLAKIAREPAHFLVIGERQWDRKWACTGSQEISVQLHTSHSNLSQSALAGSNCVEMCVSIMANSPQIASACQSSSVSAN